MKITQILAKYNYKDLTMPILWDRYLQNKWKPYVEQRWYGFNLGIIPITWTKILDEFLDYLVTLDPNFKIQQIKIKFGGIRFYISGDFKDLQHNEIETLCNALFDESLIF